MMGETGKSTGQLNYYETWQRCEKCGHVFPDGLTHVCDTSSNSTYQYQFSIDNIILERIAKALEKIVILLGRKVGE